MARESSYKYGIQLVKKDSGQLQQRTIVVRWVFYWFTMSPMKRVSIVSRVPAFFSLLLLFEQVAKILTDIRTWFSNVEQHATQGVKKILIGNKCDWEEKRAVSTERGQALADELGIPFLEVSAKSNINVEKAFYSLASEIKKKLSETQKSETPASGSSGVNVSDQGSWGQSGKCC
jgi:hypothetical protein